MPFKFIFIFAFDYYECSIFELPKIYSKELIEELFVHPYSKIDFLTKVLGVERKAASRYLSQLQDIGVLKEYKIGREKIYINVELLEMLKSSI